MSCAKSVLPVFMTKPSPRDRREEPPDIQIRPSNELSESFMHQWIPRKCHSPNRTVVTSELRSGGFLDPFTFEVGKNDFGALLKRKTYRWFYGFVVYEDVIDTEHTFYFCYRFDYAMRLFEPIPPDRNYTEHRKIERALPADRPVKGALRVTPSIPEANPPPIDDTPY